MIYNSGTKIKRIIGNTKFVTKITKRLQIYKNLAVIDVHDCIEACGFVAVAINIVGIDGR